MNQSLKGKKLSDRFYEKMQRLEPLYPKRVALLLPALQAAQVEKGWLSQEVLDEVADYLEIHPAQAKEVASFYSLYYLQPVGKHCLRICTNVACALRGAEDLVRYCAERLGVEPGEMTPDGKFTYLEEECLGACGTAPALLLDGRSSEYYENLDVDRLKNLIDTLEKQS